MEEEILDKVTLSGQFVSAYAGEVSDEELAEVNAGEYISVTKSPGTAGNHGEITFTDP